MTLYMHNLHFVHHRSTNYIPVIVNKRSSSNLENKTYLPSSDLSPLISSRPNISKIPHNFMEDITSSSKVQKLPPKYGNVITILSLDGGGVRGIIPGVILSYLESQLQVIYITIRVLYLEINYLIHKPIYLCVTYICYSI